MTCDVTKIDGGVLIMCNRSRRRKLCADCRTRPAALECDYALRGRLAGKSCDRAICAACATRVGTLKDANGKPGETIDYCKGHAEMFAKESGAQALPMTRVEVVRG